MCRCAGLISGLGFDRGCLTHPQIPRSRPTNGMILLLACSKHFNLFIVKNGGVLTPDRGSLQGITRMSVLELCEIMGIDAAVAPIPRSLLDEADDAS
jgi:Amino-transferase class IV